MPHMQESLGVCIMLRVLLARGLGYQKDGTPTASCTGVFLRALILTDMASAALVYCGLLSTSIMASPNAGVVAWLGSKRTPNPCIHLTRLKSPPLPVCDILQFLLS